MGRPFLVEFDNIGSNKLYICQVCGTPFARNTDDQYWKLPGDMHEELVWFSFLVKVSNVVDSGIIPEARDKDHQVDWQEFHCFSCNNQDGVKFMDRHPQTPIEFYSLDSNKILFHINGEDHDLEMLAPVEWLDLPQPPGERIQ